MALHPPVGGPRFLHYPLERLPQQVALVFRQSICQCRTFAARNSDIWAAACVLSAIPKSPPVVLSTHGLSRTAAPH